MQESSRRAISRPHRVAFASEGRDTTTTATMSAVRVALAQLASEPPSVAGNTDRNLERALRFIEQAASPHLKPSPLQEEATAAGYGSGPTQQAKRKADIVIFPEYFISGVIAEREHWKLAQETCDTGEGDQEDLKDGAEPVPSSWLGVLRHKARECQIDVVAGTIVERATPDLVVGRECEEEEQGADEAKFKLFNRSYYISSDGSIAGAYTKRNLWHPEKEYLTPAPLSEINEVIETRHGPVGLLVCWDLAWPEAFRALSLRQHERHQPPKLIIMPSCWFASDATPVGLARNKDAEAVFLDHVTVARAYENECALIFVNGAGSKEDGHLGRSSVSLPFYGCIARAKGSEEELMVVDIDMGVLEDAKRVYKIGSDLHAKAERASEASR